MENLKNSNDELNTEYNQKPKHKLHWYYFQSRKNSNLKIAPRMYRMMNAFTRVELWYLN